MRIDVWIECDCGEQIGVKSITTKDCPRCGRIYNLVLNKNYELVAQIIGEEEEGIGCYGFNNVGQWGYKEPKRCRNTDFENAPLDKLVSEWTYVCDNCNNTWHGDEQTPICENQD